MSEVNGQLCACDRCGAQIFRRAVGEGEADGGFTRWNKFEPYPEGWGFVEVPKVPEVPGGRRFCSLRVCPACYDLWSSVVNERFLNGTEFYIPGKED